MASMVSIILVFMLTIGGSPVVDVSPGNSTGNLSISGKPRLGDFQKKFPIKLKFSPQKPRLSFVLNFKGEKCTKVIKSVVGNTSLMHGRTYEPEVGLYYYRNRYYHPQLGRFLQQDQMGYQDSLNLYQAFGMNPVNFTDPFGAVLNLKFLTDIYGSVESAEDVVKSVYAKFRLAGDTHSVAYRKLIDYNFVIDSGSKSDELYERGLAFLPSLGVFDVTPAQFGKDLAGGVSNAVTKLGSIVAKGLPGVHDPHFSKQIDKAQKLLQSKINKAIGANEGSLGYWIGETYAPVIAGGWLSAEIELANATAQTGKTLPFLGTEPENLFFYSNKYPETASHIKDAQEVGHPSVLTIERESVSSNRLESLKGYKKVPGKQLDEYPPAMFKEGGKGASVRPISPKDNMGSGAYIGNKLRKFPNGKKIKIIVVE